MDCISSISGLPVFEVSGRTERERGAFIQLLLADLERRSLSSVFVKREEYRSRYALRSLVQLYDLVVVDAGVDLLTGQIEIRGHEDSGQDSLIWSGVNDLAMQEFTDRLVAKLDELVCGTPVWGCILIGGKSSRMGRPKHLIEDEQKTTWLERTTDILRPLVDGLVVSGAGMLPENLPDIARLADIPGVVGPLTGMLAASRWQPTVTWLLVACDMPHITTEAIQWLLSDRRAGCWGRVPRLEGNKHCEPLFAWYDFRSAQLFEEQLYDGNLRIGGAASHPKIDNPVIPEPLCYGWQNINTPEQLQAEARRTGS
ncbi:MAG: molybdenum cofactor guanylyltransferase [Desulfobulbaceae bacterium]|nr:molybdenum cofactor guanylyltransferase [Desulfobulbaceae bacterium]